MPDDLVQPPQERELDSLSKLDRRAMLLLANGSMAKVVDLPFERGLDKDELEQAQLNLPERARAGEHLMRKLGLVPAGSGDDVPEQRRGVVLLRTHGARRLTLVFSGNFSVFSIPLPLVTDAKTHIVLMRDPSRCFGLLGIPELGGDYETCLMNIERIAAALGVEELYCVGVSSGGSTALKVGCDLHVRGVLGFSVPTTLDLNDDQGAELKHYPQLTRLYARARHLGIDLAKYYASVSPRPGMMLVYSTAHIRDAWLAQRMAGVPGVELVNTEDFSGHGTYRWLRDNGGLGPLIARLFALRPVCPG